MAPRKAKTPVAEELNQNRDVDGAKRRRARQSRERYPQALWRRLDHALGRGPQHGNGDHSPLVHLSLDIALGVGGIPRGRITEIYGPESSGKTTICQHIVAEAQRLGGTAAYHRHGTRPGSRSTPPAVGVDIDNLLVSQPDTGEQALEITETLVRSGGIDVIVIDSVAALVPRSEIEGDMGDATMGVQARLMSQALRKLTRGDQPDQDRRHFYQPAAPEDRRDVRQPGNHHRRAGAQVLCLCADGCAPHPGDQGGR